MREIKFRGKNSQGDWVHGDLLRNRGETFVVPDGIANPLAKAEDFKVFPETVGQYTGRKDKNGQELYESDIFRIVQGLEKTIKFIPERGAFCVADLNYTSLNPLIDPWQNPNPKWWEMFGADTEIIGNIHDNPELLTGTE